MVKFLKEHSDLLKKLLAAICVVAALIVIVCQWVSLNEYERQNAVIKREFYQRLNVIYMLNDIENIDESYWNSICEASRINCFILDTFDFKTLLSGRDSFDLDDDMEEAIKEFFFELNEKLNETDFSDITLDQKMYFKTVGEEIHIALGSGSGNFFYTIHSFTI